jgi:hypothetical protein
MTTVLLPHRADAVGPKPRGAHHPAALASASSAGVGGNSIAAIVSEHCEGVLAPMGVIIEYLDAQVGTWQYSLDGGESWRTIRTDLINRPGHMGLALERTARLRVLPFGGGARSGARIVFHAAQRAPGEGNGSYRAYAPDDRDEAARSITLVLGLGGINGMPPAVAASRPRNKRAMAAQRCAA